MDEQEMKDRAIEDTATADSPSVEPVVEAPVETVVETPVVEIAPEAPVEEVAV